MTAHLLRGADPRTDRGFVVHPHRGTGSAQEEVAPNAAQLASTPKVQPPGELALTVMEIAMALGVSERTVFRYLLATNA